MARRYRKSRELGHELREALKDEKKAPSEYRELRKHIKSRRIKRIINRIIRDEKKHYRLLRKIRKRIYY